MNEHIHGAVRLADWGVIRAAGEEAAKFLHSQLTQDTVLQTTAKARLAGYCSAKGRLLASMLALKTGDAELLLALPAEVLAATQKRLSMFVMRAKCKLTDASADWAVWGLVGEVASDAPAAVWDTARHGEGWLVRLPDAAAQVRRYLLLQPSAAAAPALPVLTAADWDWLEVESGLAWVKSATVEAFVPQMLNLELLGGVNFQKGCYPGQEVVARSQYRGTIKRRTLLFALEGSAVVGQEIFHSADAEQPAGVVAAAATRDGQGMVLAEVKLAALAEGSLHLGAATGPMLLPRELPYTISAPE